jgi:hypothetical protein
MHAAIQLVIYWALAFLTLGMALVLLNVFFGLMGNDLDLRSAGSEAVIAAVSSLVEALSFWSVITFVPLASRALIFPVVVVGVIYKVAHYEDWGRFDVFMLLVFQAVIAVFGVSLLLGHFQTAFVVLVGFGLVLATLWFLMGESGD